jgi:hypothetical protein
LLAVVPASSLPDTGVQQNQTSQAARMGGQLDYTRAHLPTSQRSVGSEADTAADDMMDDSAAHY